MTATTASAPTTASVRPDARLGFGGVLRSEWIKFTSLRSTYWTSGIIVVLWLGLTLLMVSTADFGGFQAMGGSDADLVQYVNVFPATLGVQFGILVAGILGVLSFSGEYSTGMIRSSLTAVPSRLPVLAAKAVVVFVWSFLLGTVSALGSWALAQPFLAADDLGGALDGPSLLAFLGAAVYLGLVALFGLGIGAAVRAGAGGIAIVVGAVLVLPIVTMLLSSWIEWIGDLNPYLLSNAGSFLIGIEGNPLFGDPDLTQGVAVLVVAAWSAVALALGAVALKGRDA